jgi:hypothetical protein
MNKTDCVTERYSARTIGIILLVLGLALAALGFLILPVVGLFFAVPLLLLSALLLVAPQSKACRLITQKISR